MRTRNAAVAGSFYPDDPEVLRQGVDEMLFEVGHNNSSFAKAIIAPHAGYIYSGHTAACAIKQLNPGQIKRIILLGPTHRVLLSGLALPDVDMFETPLGTIPLDLDLIEEAKKLSQVSIDNDSHTLEHSLEVLLPFLQRHLESPFTLVPFAVGQAKPEMVSETLEKLWGENETAIVISSDLSHFHSYEKAKALDSETSESILHLEPVITHERACGATPINGLLITARQHALDVRLIDLRNSGDTAGPRDEVVGYGAFAFYENHET